MIQILIEKKKHPINGNLQYTALIQEDDPKTGWRTPTICRLSKRTAEDFAMALRNLKDQIIHHKINRD